ncbi:hypothetical protein GA0115240_11591, partial [Streptomyces sp. DvalAA-14]
MDDHDGTGIPGEDNEAAAAARPTGQGSPGSKPAVKGRRTAARTRKPAQAPAAAGGSAEG